MRRFKGGFARIAREAWATVLPVWIEGTDRVFPNRDRVTYLVFPRFWRRVTVKIGAPLSINVFNKEQTVVEDVERAMLKLADKE